MTRILCSGLLHNNRGCERRAQCANYVHWTDDPRSQFNACGSAGAPEYQHFAPRGVAIEPKPVLLQRDFFL